MKPLTGMKAANPVLVRLNDAIHAFRKPFPTP